MPNFLFLVPMSRFSQALQYNQVQDSPHARYPRIEPYAPHMHEVLVEMRPFDWCWLLCKSSHNVILDTLIYALVVGKNKGCVA